jgi:hypothetical protein
MIRKNIWMFFAAVFLVMNLNPQGTLAQNLDYEKYGRIAIAVVRADYPEAEVREYEYLGRVKGAETNVTDSFRFQIKEKGKMGYVIIRITHNLTNKKLLNLKVEPAAG